MCPFCVGYLAIGRSAPVRHPNARTGMHHRFQRRHQPAGRVPDGDASIRLALMYVRLAIGYDDDPFSPQVPRQRQLQALRRPGAAFQLRLPLDHDPIHQVPHVPKERPKLWTPRSFPAHQPSQLFAPIEPGKTRHDDHGRARCQSEEPERQEHKPPRRSLALFGVLEVVEQHDEAGRLLRSLNRNGADQHRSSGQRYQSVPG